MAERTDEQIGKDFIEATEAVSRVIGVANKEINSFVTKGQVKAFKANLLCSFLGMI